MTWKIIRKSKEKIDAPILIAGLPGIGNVGKICVDFLIEELKAKKIYDFFSNSFPHSVFVNEKNLIELPMISMYYKKRRGKQDILILTGDIQPTTEKDCYDFCAILDKIAMDHKVTDIITLGGIGLKEEPESPKLFATGNSRKVVDAFCKKTKVSNKIYGVVGPIMGVSGVLPGITKIPSVILLAETFGHPFYVGVRGSREVLNVLNKQFDLKVKVDKLSTEVEEIETEHLDKTKKLTQKDGGVNYIG